MRAIVVVVLAAPLLGGLPGPRAASPSPGHVADCGDVSIEPAATSFDTAFDVAYTIRATRRLCAPEPAHGSDIRGASALELRRPPDTGTSVEVLEAPLRFRKVRPDRSKRFDFGLPDLVPAATMANATVGTVPAGEYVLRLRYAPAPCDGRSFADACTVTSSAFRVLGPSQFVIREGD